MSRFRLNMVALEGRQFTLVNKSKSTHVWPWYTCVIPFKTLLLRNCYFWHLDTEGSFMVERALQIAEACIEDLREYDSFLRKDGKPCQINKQPNDFLANIFYFRVCSYTEQIAVVNYLEKFISEHEDVREVLISCLQMHNINNLIKRL